MTHRSGLYANVYVSTIKDYGVGDDGDGARLEITSAGWAGLLAGFAVDGAVTAYRYPDGTAVDYVEILLSSSTKAVTRR